MGGRASFLLALLVGHAFVFAASDSSAGEPRLMVRPAVPALVGPDPVEPAPLLAIDDEHVHLDGDPIPSGELGSALRKLVGIYRTLRPGQPFNGQILVACAPRTSTRLLAEYLKVLLAAEFVHPVFLFIQPDAAAKTDRSADRVTGARATMEKDATATPLKVREHASYESLARAVVAERTRGKAVFLDLGTAVATRSSRPAARPRVPAGGASPGR